MDSKKSWNFQEIENFNTIETKTISTNTEAESISLKSKKIENIACFRIEKYADELIPTSNIETATKIVTPIWRKFIRFPIWRKFVWPHLAQVCLGHFWPHLA
ncbi:MAG: hypothetical protein IPF72_13650 [Chitinophagaceae bacterium]|nr:hypothetical protein [Chitinophagaceae bacterium]